MEKFYFTYFTVKYHLGTEEDYYTYTRGTSYAEIKENLNKYIKKLNPVNEVIYVRTYRVKRNKNFKGKYLDDNSWRDIVSIAYPNSWDNLIMVKLNERKKGQHRWNHNLPKNGTSNGFKGGKENWAYINSKGKSKPIKERRNFRYSGKWKPIEEKEIIEERHMLMDALVEAYGNRSKAAKILGINRNTLYRKMRKHTDINWNKEVPIRPEKPPKTHDNSNSRQPPGV